MGLISALSWLYASEGNPDGLECRVTFLLGVGVGVIVLGENDGDEDDDGDEYEEAEEEGVDK